MNAPKLCNPGPVTLTSNVRRALAGPDVCHREPEFAALVARTRQQLLAVYPAEGYDAVLLAGSGTCAVEAMLSLVAEGERVLVLANGAYGERIAEMCRAQGKPHETIRSPWTSGLAIGDAGRALAGGLFGHVLVVHHETTTGRLNDLEALGHLCREARVPMLVDAVSSFGAEELRLRAWNVEAVAATANKCLHGAPGVSFVVADAEALRRPSGATSLYLDLSRHAAAQARGTLSFTLPTHVVAALAEALDELAAIGGYAARRAAYRARSAEVRWTLSELGVRTLLEGSGPDGVRAYGASLTSFRLPDGIPYEDLHAQLKRAGFVIYRGQGGLDADIFRVAVMGDLDDEDLARLSVALRAALS